VPQTPSFPPSGGARQSGAYRGFVATFGVGSRVTCWGSIQHHRLGTDAIRRIQAHRALRHARRPGMKAAACAAPPAKSRPAAARETAEAVEALLAWLHTQPRKAATKRPTSEAPPTPRGPDTAADQVGPEPAPDAPPASASAETAVPDDPAAIWMGRSGTLRNAWCIPIGCFTGSDALLVQDLVL
jgi:hypothetical protein